MTPRSARFLLVALALYAVAGFQPHPVAATPRQTMAPSTKPRPRIIFLVAKDVSILLHGTYPKVSSPCRRPVQPLLHARYAGTIEVGRDTDGSLFVIGELPVEEYLEGLAEMPRTWPMEALKAQAVAARSYALSHLGSPDATAVRLGYQICATDACQVYRGLGIAHGPYGDRWRKAVKATRGEVLPYRGEPANTFYFSTSNGQTFGNDEIFGGAALPYLRPVSENDDGDSPLSHWKASIPFADVGRFLAAAGDWPAGTAVTGVRRAGPDVVVSGKGTSRTLDVLTFRGDMNSWAHCLDPDHYPTDTDGVQLPQTVPSRWFGTTTRKGAVTLTGRGWGHGVGMVQWGAEGKAKRGLGYADILGAYYGGLRPAPYSEPSLIRVGIAVGLKSLVVEPAGTVAVQGKRLSGEGPWRITGGKRLHVRRTGPAPVYIEAGSLRAPGRAASGETRHATVSVPETSVVHLVLHRGDLDVAVTRERTLEPGSVRLEWKVPEVPTASYRLQAVFSDGADIARTTGANVRVAGTAPTPADPTPTPSIPPSSPASPVPTGLAASPVANSGDRGLIWLILSAAGAVLIAIISVLWLIRRARRLPGEDSKPGEGDPGGTGDPRSRV